MAEEHLHHAQVGAVIQEVGRKGVAQRVRGELLGDPGLARVALDDVPEGLARHAIATARGEEVVGLALEQDLPARTPAEFLERPHRLFTERNEPLAIALAEDADDALVDIELTLAQVHELRHPQPGRVQHFQHGAVAAAERVAHHRGRQERLDLLLGERARQRAADLRHRDLRGGVLADHALAHEITEEAAEAGQLPGGRARPRAGAHAPRDELLQVGARGAHDRHVALGEPACEGREVGAVSGERVRRQTPLHPNRVEKACHRRIRGIGVRAHGDRGRRIGQDLSRWGLGAATATAVRTLGFPVMW